MRIVIAHSFYRIGGGEDRAAVQQSALLRSDHHVLELFERNDELASGFDAARRLTTGSTKRAPILRTIQDFKPDLVHLHNQYPAIGPSVHLACRKLGLPLVITVHNFRLRCPNGFMFTEGQVCRRCEKGVYVHAAVHRCFPSRGQASAYAVGLWHHRFILKLEEIPSAFIAPSEFMMTQLAGWGIEARRRVMIRNFTDIPEDSDSSPGDYGLYVGRLSSEKGLDVLLRALREAGDPSFKIVGDGPTAQGLRQLADRLGLHRVEFLGRIPSEEVQHLIGGARFIALLSLWHENAPLAILEAFAHGTPALVAASGGLPELADDGRGFVVPPGSVQETAALIRRLFEDEAHCNRAGRAALKFARAELNPQLHKRRLEDLYASVLRV